jgi:hypothetical protein
MSCIAQILELKGDLEFLPINENVVIEGGGNYKGYEYLITFTAHGIRCGYVAIPAEQDYESSHINVHGGLTFEGENHSAKNLLRTPCSDIWLGFDAAHFDDMRDMERAKKYFGDVSLFGAPFELINEMYKVAQEMEMREPYCSHKKFEYIEGQCKSVIEQLITQQGIAA